MKLFNKKEEVGKVGRPRLADTELKKKSLIISGIMLLVVICLLIGGMFSLNIIPRFNRMKGEVITCNSIPEQLRPGYEDPTTHVVNEYGFTDINFYNAVVNGLTFPTCDLTPSDLQNITTVRSLDNKPINNLEGIQFLTRLEVLDMPNNTITNFNYQELKNLREIGINETDINKIDFENMPLSQINIYNVYNENIGFNKSIQSIKLENVNVENINNTFNDVEEFMVVNPQSKLIVSGIENAKIFDVANKSQTHLQMEELKITDASKLDNIRINHFDSGNVSDIINKIELNNLKSETSLTLLTTTQEIKITNAENLNGFHADGLNNLEITGAGELRYLESKNGNLSSINLSEMKKLESIDLENNKLAEISLSGMEELRTLILNNNNLSELNLDGLQLDGINLSSNKLKTLDLSNCFKTDEILELNLNNNELTNIVLPDNINIHNLNVESNYLESLDFTEGKNIVVIALNDNCFSEIDMTKYDFDFTGDGNFKYSTEKPQKLEKFVIDERGIKNCDLSNNNLSYVDLSRGRYLEKIYLQNNNLTSLDNININSNLKEFVFNDNLFKELDFTNLIQNNYFKTIIYTTNKAQKLEKITLNSNIEALYLPDSDLTKLEILNAPYLAIIDAQNNKLDNIKGLNNMPNLRELYIGNNEFRSLDLSNNTEMMVLQYENNPMYQTLYLPLGTSINYVDSVILNKKIEPNYNIEDSTVVSLNDNKINALKIGNTVLNISINNMWSGNMLPLNVYNRCFHTIHSYGLCPQSLFDEFLSKYSFSDLTSAIMYPAYQISQNIKVYKLNSNAYKIDDNAKTIDAGGASFDISKLSFESEGLTISQNGNNVVIKDGDNTAVQYKILNNSANSTGDNSSSTIPNSKEKVLVTTKPARNKGSNTINSIEINGDFISEELLESIKDTDTNIVITTDNGTKITINGKDIKDVKENIDFNNKINNLKKTDIYNKINKNIKNGVVLDFTSKNKLPGKVLIELDANSSVFSNIKNKNRINIYRYNSGDLILVAENLKVAYDKIKFYIDTLDSYVITDNRVADVDINKTLIEQNKTKQSFKWVVPSLIILLLLLLIIGYITYRKTKEKQD